MLERDHTHSYRAKRARYAQCVYDSTAATAVVTALLLLYREDCKKLGCDAPWTSRQQQGVRQSMLADASCAFFSAQKPSGLTLTALLKKFPAPPS